VQAIASSCPRGTTGKQTAGDRNAGGAGLGESAGYPGLDSRAGCVTNLGPIPDLDLEDVRQFVQTPS